MIGLHHRHIPRDWTASLIPGLHNDRLARALHVTSTMTHTRPTDVFRCTTMAGVTPLTALFRKAEEEYRRVVSGSLRGTTRNQPFGSQYLESSQLKAALEEAQRTIRQQSEELRSLRSSLDGVRRDTDETIEALQAQNATLLAQNQEVSSQLADMQIRMAQQTREDNARVVQSLMARRGEPAGARAASEPATTSSSSWVNPHSDLLDEIDRSIAGLDVREARTPPTAKRPTAPIEPWLSAHSPPHMSRPLASMLEAAAALPAEPLPKSPLQTPAEPDEATAADFFSRLQQALAPRHLSDLLSLLSEFQQGSLEQSDVVAKARTILGRYGKLMHDFERFIGAATTAVVLEE
jgi:histone deacetylase complex regulatory component SIN3